MPTTKITRLTGLNVRALRESLTADEPVAITGSTATFGMPAADAVTFMQTVMQRVADTHGTRAHPYASLRAVLRKVERAAEADAPATCEWFALCTNAATHDEPHPILGPVPACDRCPTIGR